MSRYAKIIIPIFTLLVGAVVYQLWHYPIHSIELLDSSDTPDHEKIHTLLQQKLGQPWLNFDARQLENTIQQLTWVDSIKVDKVNFGILSVTITAKVPFFRWHSGYLISTKGKIIEVNSDSWHQYDTLMPIESSTKGLSILTDSIQLVNALMNQAHSIFGPLQKIKIDLFNIQLIYSRQRIILKKNDSAVYLRRFFQWMEQLSPSESQTITKSKTIDLRYRDGFAISNQ